MQPNDPRFITVLQSLGPEAVKRWTEADEIGRVSMAFAVSGAVRRKMGDEAGREAFRIMFAVATS